MADSNTGSSSILAGIASEINDALSNRFNANSAMQNVANGIKQHITAQETAAATAMKNKIAAAGNFSRTATARDYTKDFETNRVRYGWSYIGFSEKIKYFNVSRLADFANAPEPYFAFILMSRPSLNIGTTTFYDDQAPTNLQLLKDDPMTAAFANDKYGYELLLSMSDSASNVWMPIITTQAKSYTANDFELKTVDKGNTYFGHVLKYGKHNEESRISGTVTIDFRNDRFLSILKMHYLWMSYIHMVSKTSKLSPRRAYQVNAILDYPASIYYLVTRRDMRELVYWDKLTGVFPLKAPFSIFNYNDGMILEDNLSIEYSYGIRSLPNDPAVLLDINVLSGKTVNAVSGQTARKITNSFSDEVLVDNGELNFVKGDVYALRPFITMEKGSTGTLRYYLRWRK